jgi:hypothetical protein
MNNQDLFSPELPDLLATVRDFIRDLTPRLDKSAAYQARIANYLLDMALRELEQGPALARQEVQELGPFLGAEGDAQALTWKLCRAIRSGELDERWNETLRLLLEQGIARVAILRPDFLAPEHQTARNP